MDTSNANHIEIPGVDASEIDVDNIEIQGVDVDIQEPQFIEIIDPDIPPTEPDPIEPATVHQEDAAADPMPVIHLTELRRSSRVRTQTENYTPSMSGFKYSYAVTQMESQGVLNPDAHMFVREEFTKQSLTSWRQKCHNFQ